MALAVAAGAMVVPFLWSPASLLSGIREVEAEALQRGTLMPAHAGLRRPVGWSQLYEDLRRRLSALPCAGRQMHLNRLIQSLAELENDPHSVSPQTVELLGRPNPDPANLASILAQAVLLDATAPRAAGAATAASRWAAIRRLLDAAPQGATATLYLDEFRPPWREVLVAHLARRDVAVSYAREIDHYEIQDQSAGLIALHRALTALADALRREGLAAEADACLKSLRALLLGLVESESDTPTRLLCVDLLTRTVPPPGPRTDFQPNTDPVASLRRLRAAYDAAVAAVPRDPVSVRHLPSLAPRQYRSVAASFVWTCALWIAALGAAASALLALLLSPFLRGGDVPHPAGSRTSWRLAGHVVVAAPAALAAMLAARQIDNNGFHSAGWMLVLGASSFLVGGAAALAFGGVRPARSGGADRGRALPALALVVLAAGAMTRPPSELLLWLRPIDLAVGLVYVIPPVMATLLFIALLLSGAPMRAIARKSAVAAALLACLSVASLQRHRAADSAYQAAVVAAAEDEFAARLGADWRDKYLKPSRAALALP